MKIGSFKFFPLNFKPCFIINIYSGTHTLWSCHDKIQKIMFVCFLKILPDWHWEEDRNTILVMASELKELVAQMLQYLCKFDCQFRVSINILKQNM